MSKIEHYSNHNKGLPKREDDFGWEVARYNPHHKIYNIPLRVKYCEVCDICWEYERYGDTAKYSKTLKYRDFPRNGLKRRVCISCKDKYLVDFSDCKLCGSELGLRRENSTIFLFDDCELFDDLPVAPSFNKSFNLIICKLFSDQNIHNLYL